MSDAIPVPVQALIALFATELAEVKFPDVDAAVLTRAASVVETAADAVAKAEAALEVARAELADAQDALLVRAHRAHAYARVFAESDVELTGRIESIQLARSRRGSREPLRDGMRDAGDTRAVSPVDAAPRRRGRPPKGAGTSPLLDSTSNAAPTPPNAPTAPNVTFEVPSRPALETPAAALDS